MGSIQNISSNTSDSQTEGQSQSQSGTNIRFQMIDFVHYTSWLDKARMKQTDQATDKSSASVLLPSLSSANYRLLREGFHPTKTDLVVSAKKLEFD